jgi:rubrerythrin
MPQTLSEELTRVKQLSGIPLNEMMPAIPTELEGEGNTIDVEILRAAVIAELDAINLYEQMANKTSNADLKKLLLDIAGEEKTHVGEFEAMLLKLDTEQTSEMKAGEKEAQDVTGAK